VSIELLARGKKGCEGKGSQWRRPAPFKRSWRRGVKRKGPISVHARWRITRGSDDVTVEEGGGRGGAALPQSRWKCTVVRIDCEAGEEGDWPVGPMAQ
jgi:hypothetical protein